MNRNKSDALFKEAQLLMPGGVNSPVRAFKNVNSKPVFFKSANGPYLIDEDENQYIDFIGSWGPMILGHSNPIIVKAINEQLKNGTSFGAPTKLENQMASLIKESIRSIERIRMVNSGTEATMSCIRLARGYTNRNTIIKFDGCYHGHVDSLLVKAGSGVSTFGLPDSPGIPEDLAKFTISIPYNDTEAFIKTFDEVKDDLAAVIVEPVAGNMGFIKGHTEFLNVLREKTRQNNSVLIFDEVMSGFRVNLGGAQSMYNIQPDLTALGKIIGGGLPVGAFGGNADIMKCLAPEGPVYQAGTLSGNPLAMSAGIALISELQKTNPYEQLELTIQNFLNAISKSLETKGIDFAYNASGGMFGFFFSKKLPENFEDVCATDSKVFQKFFIKSLSKGIYFAPSKFEAGFLSTTHVDEVMQSASQKVLDAIEEL